MMHINGIDLYYKIIFIECIHFSALSVCAYFVFKTLFPALYTRKIFFWLSIVVVSIIISNMLDMVLESILLDVREQGVEWARTLERLQ